MTAHRPDLISNDLLCPSPADLDVHRPHPSAGHARGDAHRTHRGLRSLAAAIVMATSAAAPWAQTAAPATGGAAASAPAASPYRAAVANAVNAAIELVRGGKTAEALPVLDKAIADLAAATPPGNPQEVAALQRTRGLVAAQAGNLPLAASSLEAALASNGLSEADRAGAVETLVKVNYNLKNYPAARDWARKAIDGGRASPEMSALLARSLYMNQEFAPAVAELQAAVARDTAAGRKPQDEDLRLLANAQLQMNDEAAYLATLQQLIRHHPKPEYWPDIVVRTMQQPGFAERLWLDGYRLKRHVGAMTDADDYLHMADLAKRAGLPAEAKAVLDAGFAAGVLGSGSGADSHRKQRDDINRLAAQDRELLAGSSTVPVDANAAFATGLAKVSIGQNERGIEMMKAALGKTLRQPEQARLQLGATLASTGRKADAAAVLGHVGGTDGTQALARLWLLAIDAPPK